MVCFVVLVFPLSVLESGLCYLNGINTGLIGQVILQVSVYISSRGIKFAVSKSWVANDVNGAEAKVLAIILSGS